MDDSEKPYPGLALILPLIHEGRIAEFGCGKGDVIKSLSMKLKRSFFLGIDIDRDRIGIAEKKRLPNTEFLVCDVSKPIDLRERFHYALFMDSIHEIRKMSGVSGVRISLSNAKKILFTEGTLIIRDGAAPPPGSVTFIAKGNAKERFDRFIMLTGIHHLSSGENITISNEDFVHFLTKFHKIPNDMIKSAHFSLQEYKEILNESGFWITDIQEYPFDMRNYPEIKALSQIPKSYAMITAKILKAKMNPQ